MGNKRVVAVFTDGEDDSDTECVDSVTDLLAEGTDKDNTTGSLATATATSTISAIGSTSSSSTSASFIAGTCALPSSHDVALVEAASTK